MTDAEEVIILVQVSQGSNVVCLRRHECVDLMGLLLKTYMKQTPLAVIKWLVDKLLRNQKHDGQTF